MKRQTEKTDIDKGDVQKMETLHRKKWYVHKGRKTKKQRDTRAGETDNYKTEIRTDRKVIETERRQNTRKTGRHRPGNTKWGSITVPLTSCLTGLESAVWQLTFFIFICKTDQSKPVKQEVNSKVILPPLVFPD